MLGPIFPLARCCEPAPLVSVIVDTGYGHRLANDESVGRQRDVILEGLPKGAELFVVAVGVGQDLVQELVECRRVNHFGILLARPGHWSLGKGIDNKV